MACRYYIYRITVETPTGPRVYVGKATNPSARWRMHKYDCKTAQTVLYRTWRKYENVTFEVVLGCSNKEDLNELERLLIASCRSEETCLNITDGGDGGTGLFKEICPRQHDKRVTGRDSGGQCSECRRERNRAKLSNPEYKASANARSREWYKKLYSDPSRVAARKEKRKAG